MRTRDDLILEKLYTTAVINKNPHGLVLEADWSGRYSDVEKKCFTPESVAEALNKQLQRYGMSNAEKKENPINPTEFPLISKGNIGKTQMTSGEGLDVEEFKKLLTKRPTKIFDGFHFI
jgi:hypothetical protein